MNKYIYPAIFLSIVIIVAVLIVINVGITQNYDNGEISFNYPQNWPMIPGSNPSEVVAFSQPDSGLNVTINKQVIPPGYESTPNFVLNTTESSNSGFKLISQKAFNLNGDPAYENDYSINSNGNIFLRKEVWLHKNGNLYSIIYTFKEVSNKPASNQLYRDVMNIDTNNNRQTVSLSNPFDLKSSLEESITSWDYGVLVNSFKVSSSQNLPTSPFWGDIKIPSIGVTWGIRSDTVNGYNSVYHYNDSYYPGQNGTSGLLGHRTIYSAPFARIDQLKPGDQVIIDDYLSQKKYIYVVSSNGDIRADYKVNPIKFPAGNTDLTLVTCFPPGTTEEAWLVHCKLSSIEPL